MSGSYFLVNSQNCTFDKGRFDSDAEAVRWAAGRGGSYDLLCQGRSLRGERLVASWRNGRRYHSPMEGFMVGSARPAPQAADRIFFEMGLNVCYIEVPSADDGVWEAIDGYDSEHGTDLYDRLTERDVLGVNLDCYRRPTKVVGFAERTYKGTEARRIVAEASGMDVWENDGSDGETCWWAVQKGTTSDGWPFEAHFCFPIDFEPRNDADMAAHLRSVDVTEPADPVRRTVSKASKPKPKTAKPKSKGVRR